MAAAHRLPARVWSWGVQRPDLGDAHLLVRVAAVEVDRDRVVAEVDQAVSGYEKVPAVVSRLGRATMQIGARRRYVSGPSAPGLAPLRSGARWQYIRSLRGAPLPFVKARWTVGPMSRFHSTLAQ